jgi:hypothetical protein
MKCLALLSFLIMLAGCKSSVEKNIPSGLMKDSIISRTDMINILVDVHLIEAGLQVERNKNVDPAASGELYYKNLFSHYKISKERFKLNLNYYEEDPENFRKMYEEVEKKLESSPKIPGPSK